MQGRRSIVSNLLRVKAKHNGSSDCSQQPSSSKVAYRKAFESHKGMQLVASEKERVAIRVVRPLARSRVALLSSLSTNLQLACLKNTSEGRGFG